MRSSTIAMALGLLSAGAIAQDLSHPALFPNLDKFGPTLQALPMTSRTITKFTDGRMPQGCREEILGNNNVPTNFDVYSVTFGDCAQPWLICRELNAPFTIDKLVDDMARLPVRMRQWMQNIVHFKDGGGAYYSWTHHIVLFGETVSVGIFFHEGTHAVDFGGGFKIESQLSGSAVWANAYNSDVAVPDDYARTNLVEDLAQFPGLVVYDRVTNGGFWQENGAWKISTQFSTVIDQGDRINSYGGRLYDLTNSPGLTCTHRYTPETLVDRATGAPRPNGKRDGVQARDNGIIVMPLPASSVTGLRTNCTGLH